ncbi:vanadium-dependent haloperoxidase [Terrimonas pollutisoli]|uniref:vanadium-dependent haloperoxidase n=1 Tax=Terrimonas pollutisoli TaxID=3034147 RepID=UPI0023ECAE0A|nr:vanadium-dependent haloperoxidase [Terrimonas sp. H1YJ31]
MKKSVILSIIYALIFFTAYGGSSGPFTSKDYVQALKKVTDVMVNDATSPIAASRYYAYITLAPYELQVGLQQDKSVFVSKLNKYDGIKLQKESTDSVNSSLAIVYTVLRMGERLLPSGYLLKEQTDSLLNVAAKKGVSRVVIEKSKQLGELVVQQILAYSYTDGFRNLSGYPRYTPVTGDAMWQPTGPAFMAALEPYWNMIRPFLIDSAQQFKPVPAVLFDTLKTSSFYKQLYDVYSAGKNLTKEQRAIAMFWDCNPFAVQQIGHVEFALKKISPGGHWMGITGIACLSSKKKLESTILIHAIVAITLADAFISCWDEKYRSNRVRPETAINRWIDPRWRPLLQTPPFPEYTSGHSVISTAAALVLTELFGDNFSFVDNTEKEFGLPARKFRSFRQAAQEAAISRFYGGIHYRDAIENGQEQGTKIGQFIIDKLKL